MLSTNRAFRLIPRPPKSASFLAPDITYCSISLTESVDGVSSLKIENVTVELFECVQSKIQVFLQWL